MFRFVATTHADTAHHPSYCPWQGMEKGDHSMTVEKPATPSVAMRSYWVITLASFTVLA